MTTSKPVTQHLISKQADSRSVDRSKSDRLIDRHTDRETDIHTYIRTDRQTERQTRQSNPRKTDGPSKHNLNERDLPNYASSKRVMEYS